MIYVQNEDGEYLPAPKETVISEAKRLLKYQLRRGSTIRNSTDAKEAIHHILMEYQCEMFGCLFLDNQYRVLAFKEMFRGTINSATVHPREIAKEALQLNAAAVILAHNHPSGVVDPSVNDIELTAKLKEILLIIDVRVLDHLVIGDTTLSMADAGYLS